MSEDRSSKTLRIAAVVHAAPRRRAAETLERMDAWVAAARREGVAMVCFPEMGVTGYGVDPFFAAEIEACGSAIPARLAEMAARHGMVVLAGFAERAPGGGLYATHLAAGPGGVIGFYRKLHIAPPEEALFRPGDAVPLFAAAGIRFGIQLCYDAHFPELATRMALEGADLLFIPHASPHGTPGEKRASWMRHLPARAFDNGLYVVACNPHGENGSGLRFPGIALAIGPDGRVLAEHGGGEGMMVFDFEERRLAQVRNHPLRYFLPRRRPELYVPPR